MKNEGIPSYVLIESYLKHQILMGRWEPGEKLPREQDLCTQFGVSRITIRTSLANLENEDLIERRRARGTFVKRRPLKEKQTILLGDVDTFVRESQRYKARCLSLKNISVRNTRMPRNIRDFFDMDNSDTITEIRRVRFQNNDPVQYVENFIIPEIAVHLSVKELSKKALMLILKEKIDIKIGQADSFLESIPAAPDIAKILKCNFLAPIFLYQAYICLQSGDPLEVVYMYINPTYFKFRMSGWKAPALTAT